MTDYVLPRAETRTRRKWRRPQIPPDIRMPLFFLVIQGGFAILNAVNFAANGSVSSLAVAVVNATGVRAFILEIRRLRRPTPDAITDHRSALMLQFHLLLVALVFIIAFPD